MKFIQEAFDTNWVVPLGPHVNGVEKDFDGFVNLAGRPFDTLRNRPNRNDKQN